MLTTVLIPGGCELQGSDKVSPLLLPLLVLIRWMGRFFRVSGSASPWLPGPGGALRGSFGVHRGPSPCGGVRQSVYEESLSEQGEAGLLGTL